MTQNRRATTWLAAAAAVLLILGVAQTAVAVSGGGYDPNKQDCSPMADANNAGQPGAQEKQNPEPGCHAAAVMVTDGNGTRYVEVGLDQLPTGYPSTPGLTGVGYPQTPNFPHSGCAAVNTAGEQHCGGNGAGAGGVVRFDTNAIGTCTYNNVWLPDPSNFTPPPTTAPEIACAPGADPSQAIVLTPMTGSGVTPFVATDGANFYFGADDNLDAGEHDGASGDHGTKQATNGPSDGGAISAHFTPSAVTDMPTPWSPVPIAGVSEGQCADGFCFETTTQRQQLYSGGSAGSRDATDYSGKSWDPYDCSSGDAKSESPDSCGGRSLNDWRHGEKQSVYAEPGFQIYEDPDAQSSPIDPLYDAGITPTPMLYPLPGTYVGTCGVTLGGGPVAQAPASPATNSAGQFSVSPTGC